MCADSVQVPPGNLEPRTLFNFAVADFEATWDALVGRPESSEPGVAGGNFMLAKQAVLLLELSSRVAAAEGPNGGAIRQFSQWIETQNRRYFLELPGDVQLPGDFVLPHSQRVPCKRQLLALIFDLVRNGQAHYYQQIPATLSDGSIFGISITGAEPGRPTLDALRHDPNYATVHLELREQPGLLRLIIQPEVLFLDVMVTAQRAQLFTGTLPLARFTRELDCTLEDLRSALSAGRTS
jgi:hypothetical protein